MCAKPVSKGDITLDLGLVNSDVFFFYTPLCRLCETAIFDAAVAHLQLDICYIMSSLFSAL